MSLPAFLRCPELEELGVDHGLGTRASARVEIPGLVRARQVHGTAILRAPLARPESRGDALWTREPGVAVGIHTADCVPILLADRRRRGVAAVHAGWRGSAAGLATLAVQRLCRELGAPPTELLAVIGPHIGVCCYEVDRSVRAVIRHGRAFRPGRRPGHHQLDLLLLNRHQLLAAGLLPERVLRVGGCTCCEAERYASYRRDGTGGRMLHYIRMPGS
ncbi:MAG: polyphenol oxidase family protein [Myxococcota bacterium]